MLHLIGTCHIDPSSPKILQNILDKVNPDVIAIEGLNLEDSQDRTIDIGFENIILEF